MNATMTDDTIVIALSGRIDTNNAAEVEQELMGLLAENQWKRMVLDAGKLEYISSAGLRVLMKLRKMAKSDVPIVNVSSEVFEILEVTGFVELFDVQKRLREVSVEGLPLIGAGANGKVYRLDQEKIIKVYNPISNPPEKILGEKQVAKKAFVHGVPSAISFDVVRVGDSLGIVYEMIDSKTLGTFICKNPDRLEECAVRMGTLLKKLHSTAFEPGILPDARNNLHARAEVAERSGYYQPETIHKMHALIDAIPVRNTFIHGDFHPANIMVNKDEWLLIDMGDASVGHPVIDLLASFHLMKLVGSRGDNALRFVGIPGDLLGKMWDIFIRTYLETENAQLVEDVENTLNYYAQIRSLNGVAFVPAYSDAQRPRVAKTMEGAFLQSYEQWGDSLLKKLPL